MTNKEKIKNFSQILREGIVKVVKNHNLYSQGFQYNQLCVILKATNVIYKLPKT